MDYNKYKKLIEKYWAGETSEAEEQWLFSKENTFPAEAEESKYFEQIGQYRQLDSGKDFSYLFADEAQDRQSPIIPLFFWRVAAVLLIGFSLYFLYQPMDLNEPEAVLVAEEDPEKAYEVTRQALLLISQKLNKASELTVALDKFEEAKEKITIQK